MARRAKSHHSSAALFLIELIVAIGIFALAGAVCVQMLARAAVVSAQSAALSRATLCAQSAAESFRAAGGELVGARALLGAGELSDGRLVIGYNKDWILTSPAQSAPPAYVLTLTRSQSGGVVFADIAVEQTGGGHNALPLYRLRVGAPAFRRG